MFKQDLLVLIGGSILSLEMKGDLLGRDEPPSTPQFPVCPCSLPPSSPPLILRLPTPRSTQYCFFPQALLQKCQPSHRSSSQSELRLRSGARGWREGMENRNCAPKLLLHGGAVHSQRSGWMGSGCGVAGSANRPESLAREAGCSAPHRGTRGPPDLLPPTPIFCG